MLASIGSTHHVATAGMPGYVSKSSTRVGAQNDQQTIKLDA